jgi:septal ring factor EnvC (AmiA/AmiB activator)
MTSSSDYTWVDTKYGKIAIAFTNADHAHCTTYPDNVNDSNAKPLKVNGKERHISMHVYLISERTDIQKQRDVYWASGVLFDKPPATSVTEKVHVEVTSAVKNLAALNASLVKSAQRRSLQNQFERAQEKRDELSEKLKKIEAELFKLENEIFLLDAK